MGKVFVSHAYADLDYATDFVDTLLKLGCGLTDDDVFFTSVPETGVPAGETLLQVVRDELDDAAIVIALITPMYFSRSVCVAELGAAWLKTGSLVPLLAPGMSRRQAEGVLGDRLLARADDAAQLDQLRDRLAKETGKDTATAGWNRHKAEWVEKARSLAGSLAAPGGLDEDEARALRAERDMHRDAGAEAEEEISRLTALVEKLRATKGAEEVRAAMIPDGYVERVAYLRDELADALDRLPRVVAQAVFLEGRGEELILRYGFDDLDQNSGEIEDAIRSGYLSLPPGEEAGPVALDHGSLRVEEAWDAREDLATALSDADDDYRQWFRGQYEHGPILDVISVWDDFVRSRGPAQRRLNSRSLLVARAPWLPSSQAG